MGRKPGKFGDLRFALALRADNVNTRRNQKILGKRWFSWLALEILGTANKSECDCRGDKSSRVD